MTSVLLAEFPEKKQVASYTIYLTASKPMLSSGCVDHAGEN